MQQKISSRGETFAAKRPTFFDVLSDLWDPESNVNGILNLGLAENSLIHQELVDFMNTQNNVKAHALTYGDGFTGSKALREALCRFLNRTFNPHVPLVPPHLLVTSGVSNAVECCAWSLFEPGDYVLIGRPYWTTFRHLFGTRAGVNILEVSSQPLDPFSHEAVGLYEKAYKTAVAEGKKAKAILLCSPNNPLGRCYRRDVLEAYMKLCNTYQLHLISDEIYGLSVWNNPKLGDSAPFTSVLTVNAAQIMDPSMVHVVWGLSKDFGATGLRIGCLISQGNPAVLKSAEGISLFNFPSSLADNDAKSLLMNDELVDRFVSLMRSRLSESYHHVTGTLRKHNIPFQESNSALFVWANLAAVVKDGPVPDEEILSRLREKRVYVTSGSTYASEAEGWFRLVIAHPRHVLDEGLNRIVSALL